MYNPFAKDRPISSEEHFNYVGSQADKMPPVKPDQHGNTHPAAPAPAAKRPAEQPAATYAETTADVVGRALANHRAEHDRLVSDIAKLEADLANLRKSIAGLEAAQDALTTADLVSAIEADAADGGTE